MKRLGSLALVLCFLFAAVFPISAIGAAEKVQFTVVFKGEKLPDNAAETVRDMGGKIVYSIPEIGVAQVEAPASFAKAALGNASIQAATPSLIEDLPNLESASLDTSSVTTENASLYNRYQWDIKRVTHQGESFKLNTGDHHVVVGIIDTGVDSQHPDLVKNLMPGSKNFVPVGGVYGNDLTETGNPNDFEDRNGHGSHVAGSIAGNGAILGVAPDVGYRSYRVFGGVGGAYSSWIIKAIVAAANDGVDVISMSLGGIYVKGQVWYTDPSTGEKIRLGSDVADYVAYQRAANYANSKGALIVAAAGNSALNGTNKKEVTDYANALYGKFGYTFVGASFYTPASIPNVVTVSATGPDDQLSLYSNYGPGFVDLAAPGGDYRIYLNTPKADRRVDNVFGKEFCLSSVPLVKPIKNAEGTITGYNYGGHGYSFYIGTSMATPKVSAVASLIVAKYGKMEPAKLKVLLQQSAEDIGAKGYDSSFGHGMVDAYKALGGK